MAEKKFYIQRYLKSEQGAWKADGVRKSLEDDFGGGSVRYKSLDGLNSKGKQKGVYTESYPESDALRVFVDPNARHENTNATLSVCVFGYNVDGTTEISITEQIKAAEKAWDSLYTYLEGALILWYDDYRQKKALFLVQDATEPSTDNIKNIPYLLCSVKLVNVFGQSFDGDSTTIEDWLKNGGKQKRQHPQGGRTCLLDTSLDKQKVRVPSTVGGCFKTVENVCE